MNKIKVVLSGKEYTIQTEESVSYVKEIAEALDSKIEDFMQQNDTITVTSACMLVALSLMDDCIKSSSDKENMRKQIIEYSEEAIKARNEMGELKKELEALKQENDLLSVKLLSLSEKTKKNEKTK